MWSAASANCTREETTTTPSESTGVVVGTFSSAYPATATAASEKYRWSCHPGAREN